MLLAGIVLGLIAGLAAGGRLDNLLAVRLRWTTLIFAALALRLATEAALLRDVAIADQLRLPLLATAYGILVVALWANRRLPGIGLALVGTALNGTAIIVNGGYMPVWDQALAAAGLTPADIGSPIHFVLSFDPPLEFLRHAGPLGDVIPDPAGARAERALGGRRRPRRRARLLRLRQPPAPAAARRLEPGRSWTGRSRPPARRRWGPGGACGPPPASHPA